jgi:hypothetical protein
MKTGRITFLKSPTDLHEAKLAADLFFDSRRYIIS